MTRDTLSEPLTGGHREHPPQSASPVFRNGNARGLDGDLVEPLRKMLAFIVAADDLDELATPPNYGLHPLTGDHAGSRAMTVTHNWRMTFALAVDQAIVDLDLEDCHGAFLHRASLRNAMFIGLLELDPLWPEDWQEWNGLGWGWGQSRRMKSRQP